MRESNFRSVPSNRAAVSITSSLYDRRALDCSSDKPLINSLYHLSVLASTSARVRETLCVDGGLERLVAILKECRDTDGLLPKSRSPLIAWKWILALQCLVYLGTRGTETVRRRVVEAGIVPVITTVLDNYLQHLHTSPKKEKDRCHHSMCGSYQVPSVATAPPAPTVAPQSAASFQLQQAPPASATGAAASVVVRHHLPLSDTASTVTSTSTASSMMSASTAATELSISSSTGVASLSSSISSSNAVPQSSSSPDRSQMSTSALGGSFASALIQASAVAAATPSTEGSDTTINTHTNHPLSFNRVHLHSQASNAVFHAHAQAAISQGPSEDTAMRSVSPETAVASSTTTLENNPNPQNATTTTQELQNPQIPEPAMADLVESAQEWPALRLAQPPRGPAQEDGGPTGEEAVSQQNMNTATAAASSTANSMVRTFQDNVIVPRDEDVVWSLEILAFVSKYAYLRQALQVSHLVPQLSLRDPNLPPLVRADTGDMMDVDEPPSLVQTSEWDYDCYDFESECDIDREYLGETVNVFPLVEKFTLKSFSRDIQYWAGVIMRNSCRKNESKGGIRQCANFECGKWEAFPRQFAKCRRCKRTKYCSKDCQLRAWTYHRHWCVPSTSSSSSSSASTSSSTTGATSSSGQPLAAARSATVPASVGAATTGTPIAVPQAVGRPAPQ